MERPNVASANDRISQGIQPRRISVGSLSLLELGEERVLLGQLGEDAGEVVALLRGGLGAVSVRRR